MIARRLFPLQLIICAAPAYLHRYGAPERLGDLAHHRCSTFRHSATGRVLPWYLQADGHSVEYPVAPWFCVNNEDIETQVVLSGNVIGLLTGVAAAAHIRAGRLVPLLTKHIGDRSSVFLYYGSRRAQPERVRAFIDLAVERLSNSPDYVLSNEELETAEAEGARLQALVAFGVAAGISISMPR